MIDVSLGELLDRIAIVELKTARVSDLSKRGVAAAELVRLSVPLRRATDTFGLLVEQWRGELHDINSRLWEMESEQRAQIAAAGDIQHLSRRAVEIVRLNDLRAATKARINASIGIDGEVKDYGGGGLGARTERRQLYCQVDEFLSQDEKEELLERIIVRRSEFEESAVNGEAANYRASLAVAADADTRTLLSRRISENKPLLALIADDAKSLNTEKIECQVTAHGDLCYFHAHSDNGSDAVRYRALTYVYYLRLRQKSFFGGELKIYPDRNRLDEAILIKPTNNSVVFFRSELLHEVLPTYVPSGTFEDSRFTVNGWISSSASYSPDS